MTEFETELLDQLKDIAFQLTLISSLCTKIGMTPEPLVYKK